MLVRENSANVWIFSLIILAGISVFCEALVLSNLRISFSISPIFTSLKWNVLFLLYFGIAGMTEWFLYFKMALTTGSLMFSITELFELNFGILKLVSAIFYQIFIFHQMIALQKLWKMFFISSKRLFRSWDIQIFIFLSSPLFFPCQPLL